jgi:hypothetical protein
MCEDEALLMIYALFPEKHLPSEKDGLGTYCFARNTYKSDKYLLLSK